MASSTLKITVQTDESSYYFEENITVYGEVTVDGVPLESKLVAFEVHDAVDTPIITRTLETNTSGTYSVQFLLSSEASPGTYTVYVSCTHDEANAVNSTSFELKQPSVLVVTVKTDSQSYKVDDTVSVQGNVTLMGLPLPEVLVALEVQDPNNTPVVVRVVETDIHGSYQLTFQVPTESKTGSYTVYGTVGYEGQNALSITVFQLLSELVGDITGDGKVDIRDVTVVAMAFGSKPGDENWNEVADLNGDEVIDIRDITIVALEFGKMV